jgi:hypothetical protein
MRPNQALFDAIFLSKVLRAQEMTPAERLIASLRHSDDSVTFMRAGVRNQFPDASEEEVERRLIERVRLIKRMHERR